MLYSRQIQISCIWLAPYRYKVLQSFSGRNLPNIAHKYSHVSDLVCPVRKTAHGGIKIPPNIAENPNKISVQNRFENASQKSTIGAVKFVSEYFFLTDIFRYTSFFSIFLWKFEISSQKSISNCISTQLCQQIIYQIYYLFPIISHEIAQPFFQIYRYRHIMRKAHDMS